MIRASFAAAVLIGGDVAPATDFCGTVGACGTVAIAVTGIARVVGGAAGIVVIGRAGAGEMGVGGAGAGLICTMCSVGNDCAHAGGAGSGAGTRATEARGLIS